jgi:hypothetical protein
MIRVSIDGVWIGNWTYRTPRDYALQITITQRLVFSVTVFTALLGSGYQQCSVLSSVSSCPCWLALSAAAPELN